MEKWLRSAISFQSDAEGGNWGTTYGARDAWRRQSRPSQMHRPARRRLCRVQKGMRTRFRHGDWPGGDIDVGYRGRWVKRFPGSMDWFIDFPAMGKRM